MMNSVAWYVAVGIERRDHVALEILFQMNDIDRWWGVYPDVEIKVTLPSLNTSKVKHEYASVR
ncbi:hypothetical protein BST67_18820 [Bradyrhizobium canariense]|nr:hypothetical protein BST67_18820 [Bradyrhizobium canariense]